MFHKRVMDSFGVSSADRAAVVQRSKSEVQVLNMPVSLSSSETIPAGALRTHDSLAAAGRIITHAHNIGDFKHRPRSVNASCCRRHFSFVLITARM